MKTHPLAELFPIIEDVDLADLVADVKKHGLRTPIVLLDGMILDGRNRQRACELAGINPTYSKFQEKDPLAFVLSANLHRRHLTTSQRAMVAAKLLEMKAGANLRPDKNKETLNETAKDLKVSPRSVEAAKQVIHDKPEQVSAVERGEKTIHKALTEPTPKAEPQSTDKLDRPIPKVILDDYRRAEEIATEAMRQLSRMKCAVEKALDEKDIAFVACNNQLVADLSNAWDGFKNVLPLYVCPRCGGLNRKACQLCRKRGFIHKFAYETLPEEERRMLEGKKKK